MIFKGLPKEGLIIEEMDDKSSIGQPKIGGLLEEIIEEEKKEEEMAFDKDGDINR